MKRYIHLFLIALLSLDSCTQNQFKYTVSDYNSNEGIKRVNTPVTVIKKESPVGIGSRILMPLIGGFFGYKYLNLTTGYTNDGVKTVSAPLGAGTGAVIGFGISNALISSQKKQKVSELQNNTKEYEEWLRKSFNKRGNYIAVGDYTSWIFVDKNRESNFQIRNFQDLDLFCKAFPNSGYHDRVIDQAVANFDRNDLRYAIALSNTPERTSRLKDAFLNKSSSYTEVIDAYQAYPTLKERAELKFMELLDSKDAILAFIKEYPNSRKKETVIQKLFANSGWINGLSRNEANFLLNTQSLNLTQKNTAIDIRISQASDFQEITSDYTNFSDKKEQIEDKAAYLVKDIETLQSFKGIFRESKYLHNYSEGIYNPLEGILFSKFWNNNIARPIDKSFGIFISLDEEYMGEYYSGQRSGKGKLKANLKNPGYEITYDGDFANGEFNGQGSFVDNYKDCYINYTGGFKDGSFEGYGTATGKLGCYSYFGNQNATYSGSWRKGRLHGNGKYTQGELWYEGSFESGAMSGEGTLRLPNGIRVSGPWKDHHPNGAMTLAKWTMLFGFDKKTTTITAYSIKDLEIGESDFIGEWNSSQRESSDRSARRSAEEKEEREQDEKRRKDEDDEKRIKKCILDINKALKKLSYKEEGILNDCPCLYYEDPSFLGYQLILRENSDDEWFYKVTALLNFKGWQGPYVSKGDAIKAVCEID
jgi:hypothetical protein